MVHKSRSEHWLAEGLTASLAVTVVFFFPTSDVTDSTRAAPFRVLSNSYTRCTLGSFLPAWNLARRVKATICHKTSR